ncbi:DUF5325 family protein [Bacillus sp. SL00103]
MEKMKQIKWLLLLCALLAVVSMAFIGVTLAEKTCWVFV